jgi:hypothetical protein
LSDAEGLVWHAASANNWVYSEPVEIGQTGLGGAGFQHPMSSPANAEREPAVLRLHRTIDLLIDSTGIKAEGEGALSGSCYAKTLPGKKWNARKHGGSKRRVWRKIHIGIDEETLEVRAVEVTGSNIGDAPMLPELLNQIPPDQDIGSVTADGAYDTRKCHEAIAARNAHAVIPPRKNAKPWKPTSAGAIARNDAVNAQRYLGSTLWRRWSGYHRRNRVETNLLGTLLRNTLPGSGCIV